MKSKPSSIVSLIVMLALTAMHGVNTFSTETIPSTSALASTTEGINNETSVFSTTNGSTSVESTTSPQTTSEFTTSGPSTADFNSSQSTTENFTTSDPTTIQFTTSQPTTNNFTTTVLTMTPPTIAMTSITTKNTATATNSNPSDVKSNTNVTIGLSVSLAVVSIAFIIFFVYVRLDRRKKRKDIENEPDDETKNKKSSALDLKGPSPKRPESPHGKPDSPERKIHSPDNHKIHEETFVYDEGKTHTATTTTGVDTFAVNKRQTEVFYLTDKPKPATLVSTGIQTNTVETSIPVTIDVECQTEAVDGVTDEEIIVIKNFDSTNDPEDDGTESETLSSGEHKHSTVSLNSVPKTPEWPESRSNDDSDSDISVKIFDDNMSDYEFDSNRWSNSKVRIHLDENDPVKPASLESNKFKYRIPILSPEPSSRKPRKRIKYSRYNFVYKSILDELLTPQRKTNSQETLQTSQCHCKLPIGKAKWELRRLAPNL